MLKSMVALARQAVGLRPETGDAAKCGVPSFPCPSVPGRSRHVYDPYGNVTIYDDDWSETRETSDYDNSILYCGYYHDSETGLYHVRHRYYHAPLGRWITRDPIGYADGPSLYQYVLWDPISGIDPLGLASGCSGASGTKATAAKTRAKAALNELSAAYGDAAFYHAGHTGIKSLLEEKLPTVFEENVTFVMLSERKHETSEGPGHMGYFSVPRFGTPRVVFLPTLTGVFHELIHAYEHFSVGKLVADIKAWESGGKKGRGMHEDIAYGATVMERSLRTNLVAMERLLNDDAASDDPSYVGLIAQKWQNLFSHAQLTAGGQTTSAAARRIKNDLGFYISCEELASFYNDIERWPSVDYMCIQFVCRPTPHPHPLRTWVRPVKTEGPAGAKYYLGPREELPQWQR